MRPRTMPRAYDFHVLCITSKTKTQQRNWSERGEVALTVALWHLASLLIYTHTPPASGDVFTEHAL